MTTVERSPLSDESRTRLSADSAYYAGGLGVATYDLLQAQPGGPLDGDIDFYADCAARYGGPVLELASGTGRILWPLVEAGHEVTGIDLSDAMLARAAEKGAQHPPEERNRARLVRMDMTVLDLDLHFALAIIPARAFHHLTEPEDQRRCLRAIHRHLEPGGHLVIDLFDPQLDLCVSEAAAPSSRRERLDPETGLTMRRTIVARTCDPQRQLLVERLLFEAVDAAGIVVQSEETQWALRWVLRQEMRYLLELSGFEAVAEYSDFSASPPAYGKEQIWVARRC